MGPGRGTPCRAQDASRGGGSREPKPCRGKMGVSPPVASDCLPNTRSETKGPRISRPQSRNVNNSDYEALLSRARLRSQPCQLWWGAGRGAGTWDLRKKSRATPSYLFGETGQTLPCRVGRGALMYSAGEPPFSIVLSPLDSSYFGHVSHSTVIGS